MARAESSRNRKFVRGIVRPLACALVLLFASITVSATVAAEETERWFEADGLPKQTITPPDRMDLSSPRESLRTFFSAIDDGDFKSAASALHPPRNGEVPDAEMARKLGQIMERRVWVDRGSISDRPDGLIELAGDHPRAGEKRRSIALDTLDLDPFPVTIRLNRYKAPDADPVWLFSDRTVEAIDKLHERYGPGWLEKKLPEGWKASTSILLKRWELVGLPIVIAVSLFCGWLVHWAIGSLRLRMSRSRAGRALHLVRTPAAILTGVIVGQLATTSAVGFSGSINAVLDPLLLVLIVIAVGMAMLRIIDAVLTAVTERFVGEIDDELDRDERHFYTSIYALRRVIVLLAVMIGAGLVIWETGVFRNLGISFLASAGVATVILGLAAQTVLGNIFSSLQIAMAKPIRIGDAVNYEGQWSYVEAIFYTYVRIRTWDNRRLIIPVKYFVSHPFENWSMVDKTLTETFWLILDHRARPDELRQAFLKMADEDDDVLEDEALKMQVLKHTEVGIHCRFYVTGKDPLAAWNIQARMREKIIDWVNENHPEWWPRERIISVGNDKGPVTDGVD